jgi:hypothetical protein
MSTDTDPHTHVSVSGAYEALGLCVIEDYAPCYRNSPVKELKQCYLGRVDLQKSKKSKVIPVTGLGGL